MLATGRQALGEHGLALLLGTLGTGEQITRECLMSADFQRV
jgi:hypothetical protein